MLPTNLSKLYCKPMYSSSTSYGAANVLRRHEQKQKQGLVHRTRSRSYRSTTADVGPRESEDATAISNEDATTSGAEGATANTTEYVAEGVT